MAPLTRNRAPGAVPTALMAEYYAQRASAGLLVSEGTAVSHQGQGYADVPGLYTPEQLEGWKRVTDAVHARGGRIVTQLWHVGRVSHVELQPDGQPPVGALRHRGQDQDLPDPRRRRQLRRHLDPARAGGAGIARHRGGLPSRRARRRERRRLRRRRGARGQRLPARPVPQAQCQPARRRLRRLDREPRPPAAGRDAGGGAGRRRRGAPASACRRSRRPTTSTTPSRSRCSTTWCGSWRRWAWPTCTSSKVPPAARASCRTGRSTSTRCAASTATPVAGAPGW